MKKNPRMPYQLVEPNPWSTTSALSALFITLWMMNWFLLQ